MKGRPSLIDIPINVPFRDLDGRELTREEFSRIYLAAADETEEYRDPNPFIEKAIRELTEKHRAEEREQQASG